MEIGARELVQFGLLVATIAGSFQVVKSKLIRTMQDLQKIMQELTDINTRVDDIDSKSAVLHHQISVIAGINSPKVLDDHARSHARIETQIEHLSVLVKDTIKMHNGRHPPVG